MTDLMEKGAAFLAAQQKEHVSKLVLYTRVGGGATHIAATIGRTEFEQADENGLVLRTESRDFIVKAADFVLSGVATTPQDGDEIREDFGSQVFVYRVMAPGGEQPWKYADLHRQSLRIHTKNVGTE